MGAHSDQCEHGKIKLIMIENVLYKNYSMNTLQRINYTKCKKIVQKINVGLNESNETDMYVKEEEFTHVE